ncbi:MAG: AIPR family protein [Ignavibacteria bacterium]|nr:AIPR family protein [Ignavibacteria bacterium]
MSNISSFSLINSKVQKIKTEENLSSPGFAFMKFALATILKLNEEEVEDSLTDGPDDGEIDAVYIENNIVHIFTFKYTDQFELSKKNYPGSELEQFALHVDLFISGNLTKITINNAVWEKYEAIKNLTSRKIEFKIYVVSNKLEPTGSSSAKLEDIIAKFKGVEKPIYIDQEKLVEIVLDEKVTKINGSFHFIDKKYFEKSDGGIKTVIGIITAMDLIKLIKSNNDETLVNESIFNENVRVYKPNHRINKEIIESAKSNRNFEFFYLNNGITILCEEVDYLPNTRNPFVELTNLQIINGGQTSHSLFQVFKSDPEKLEDIELLVRICIAKRQPN